MVEHRVDMAHKTVPLQKNEKPVESLQHKKNAFADWGKPATASTAHFSGLLILNINVT